MHYKIKFLSLTLLLFLLFYENPSVSEELKADSSVALVGFLAKIENLDKHHLLNIYTGNKSSYQNYKKSLHGFYQNLSASLKKNPPTNLFEVTENQSIDLIYASRNALVDNLVNIQSKIFNDKLILGKEKIILLQKIMRAINLQYKAGSMNEDVFRKIRWAVNKDIKEHSFHFRKKYFLLDVKSEVELLKKKEIPLYYPLDRWEIEVVSVKDILTEPVENTKNKKLEIISSDIIHIENNTFRPPYIQPPSQDNKVLPSESMLEMKNQECMLDDIESYLDKDAGVQDYCHPDSSENQRFDR